MAIALEGIASAEAFGETSLRKRVNYRSASSGIDVTAGTTFTIAKPSGVIEGDVLLTCQMVDTASTANIQVAPTGGTTWVKLIEATPPQFQAAVVWWKVAGPSEPINYTYTKVSGETCAVVTIACRDANKVATPVSASSLVWTAGSITSPAITAPGSRWLDVRFAAADLVATGTPSYTAPATMTERADIVLDGFRGLTVATATRADTNDIARTFSPNANIDGAVSFTIGVDSALPDLTLFSASIASGETFGTLSIAAAFPQTVIPSGIPAGEAVGIPKLDLVIFPGAIPSGESFGAVVVDAGIRPSSIPSSENFGLITVIQQQFVTPTGILSGESFGVCALQLGYPQEIQLEGLSSDEVFGNHLVSLRSRLLFTTPSIQEAPAAWDRLNIRFGIHRGITIIKHLDGSYRAVRYPAQTELEDPSIAVVYMGGRRHVIDVAEAQALIAAGYAAYISLELIE